MEGLLIVDRKEEKRFVKGKAYVGCCQCCVDSKNDKGWLLGWKKRSSQWLSQAVIQVC